jgi:hypothetical protein
MARQYNSYFGEMRMSNNPEFYKNMRGIDLCNQVPRIIRDIKYDNIVDQDYQYFLNEKILGACIEESRNQYEHADTICNALNFYTHCGLIHGFVPYWGTNVSYELAKVSNAQRENNNKAYLWRTINRFFTDVSYGADPMTLKGIQTMNFNPSKDL